jgi:hypothetical protein
MGFEAVKTAICFSGQIRAIEKTWSSIKNNIIDPNNADLFLHTWHDSKGCGAENISSIEEYFLDKNILKMKLESFHGWTWSRKESTYETQSPMFYSMLESNKLKKQYELENNFIYDLVIRCRMDCLFREPLHKNEIEDVITNNNVFYTRGEGDNPWVDSNFYMNGKLFICDIFFYGPSKVMDLLTSVYDDNNLLSNTYYNASEDKIGVIVKNNNLIPKLSNMRFDRQKRSENIFFSNYLDEGYVEKNG